MVKLSTLKVRRAIRRHYRHRAVIVAPDGAPYLMCGQLDHLSNCVMNAVSRAARNFLYIFHFISFGCCLKYLRATSMCLHPNIGRRIV